MAAIEDHPGHSVHFFSFRRAFSCLVVQTLPGFPYPLLRINQRLMCGTGHKPSEKSPQRNRITLRLVVPPPGAPALKRAALRPLGKSYSFPHTVSILLIISLAHWIEAEISLSVR